MEIVVKLAFVDKLRMVSIDGLNFDSHFKVGPCVDSLINLSEGPLINLPDDFEVLAHFLDHLGHLFYLNAIYYNDNLPSTRFQT